MTIIVADTEGKIPLDLEILVNEEDNTVYVKFSGFEDISEADAYAEHLSDYLPLILFESEIKH